MDQGYAYEEEAVEEGLTFKKIGHFFKVGYLIIIISVVAAVLLAAAVALPIKFFAKSEPVGETSIEFIYDGVDEGLDPAGGVLNTSNIIAANVLDEAVKRSELTGVVKDISKLRKYTRVEAVLPEDYLELRAAAAEGDQNAINALRNYELHPTRYTIVVSNPKGLGLSDAQTVLLLNKIVEAYMDDFQKRFSVSEMFDADMYNLSHNENVEYFDIYDEYVGSLPAVVEYLKQLQTEAPTFVSTGKGGNSTFTSLISEIGRLQDDYSRFNAFLLSNNVWKDKATAVASLENNLADITAKLDNLMQYRIEPLKQLIDGIKPNSITSVDSNGNPVVTNSYPEEYYKYLDELNELIAQSYSYQNQLSDINLRIERLDEENPTSEALLARASATVVSLETHSADLVAKVNATITDYYDTTFVSTSVRRVAPAVVTRRTMSFSIIIVFVVAAIAGLVVGCIINGVVMAKSSKKAQKVSEAPADKVGE